MVGLQGFLAGLGALPAASTLGLAARGRPATAAPAPAPLVRGLDIAGSENDIAVRSIFAGAPIADYATLESELEA